MTIRRLTNFSEAFIAANRGNPCVGCTLAQRCATKRLACLDFHMFYQQITLTMTRVRLAARKKRHSEHMRQLSLLKRRGDDILSIQDAIEEDVIEIAALSRMLTNLHNVRTAERAEGDLRRLEKQEQRVRRAAADKPTVATLAAVAKAAAATREKRDALAAHEITLASENVDSSRHREPEREIYDSIFRVDPLCTPECGIECGIQHRIRSTHKPGRPRGAVRNPRHTYRD